MSSAPNLLEYTLASSSDSINNNNSTATSSEHISTSPNLLDEKFCFKSSNDQLQCAQDQVNIACNDNQRINTILQACFVNKSSTKPQAELELDHAKKQLMILTKAIDCIENWQTDSFLWPNNYRVFFAPPYIFIIHSPKG
jgi:hypothetical protein